MPEQAEWLGAVRRAVPGITEDELETVGEMAPVLDEEIAHAYDLAWGLAGPAPADGEDDDAYDQRAGRISAGVDAYIYGAWEKVGEVAVDSARVAILDPAYLGRSDLKFEFPELTGHIVQRSRDDERTFLAGEVVQAGKGDGVYDVLVRRVDVEGYGNRIAELRVVFISENQ
jgi:hypothetical protein